MASGLLKSMQSGSGSTSENVIRVQRVCLSSTLTKQRDGE